jgi:hypothetical protein
MQYNPCVVEILALSVMHQGAVDITGASLPLHV